MDLPGAAAPRGDPAGDLPQRHRLPLARALADAQVHGHLGELVSWARPRSSVQVTVVNDSAGRSGAGLLRQVSRPNPAAVISANSAGDQPPRSKHTVTRRPSPTMTRRSGSRRRSSPASESDGSAMTMNTGSPSWPVT